MTLPATVAAPRPTAPGPLGRPWRGGAGDGLAYGALGLPLAFVALPLYVVLPNHYASAHGVPLAALGAVLLGARLLDAVADPWIGRFVDRRFAASTTQAWSVLALASVVLALAFGALFFPAVQGTPALLAWCAAGLAVAYLAYSLASVVHQAWGARLGGDAVQRARIVGWREGAALLGVLVASVLPAVGGLEATVLVFAATLAIGVACLRAAPRPDPDAAADAALPATLPLHTAAFRRLLAVFLLNGIASAIPATLVLFFVRDRLQAPAHEPLFLGAYFAAGALAIPMWVRAVGRFGLARSWLAGMLLAVAAFVWATQLGPGDVTAFAIVCVASGVALGADLGLPGAMLAGVIRDAGHGGRAEGAYFGWWNFATKLNLALAAGIALPALQAFGYAPGSRDADALDALSWAYGALPCVLKLGAAALLWALWIRPEPSPARDPA